MDANSNSDRNNYPHSGSSGSGSDNGSDNDMPDTWVPDDAVAALAMERTFHNETPAVMARRLFQENAANAAAAICHIAVHGTNERIRLDAAKYVVERVLGRVGDDIFEVNPVDELISSVTTYVNSY